MIKTSFHFAVAFAAVTMTNSAAYAQRSFRTPAVMTSSVDANQWHSLRGNTRREAIGKNDRGRVADTFPLEHLLLELKRPPELQADAERFAGDLYNPASPNYHKWMTAEDFGQSFGVAQQDIDNVSGWLQSQGFKVNGVFPNRTTIDFSGTARQIRQAFHTELHHLNVNGSAHIANMSDPQIPAALAPAVAGIISLNDFHPHAMHSKLKAAPALSSGSTSRYVAPGDLATIYNFNPVFSNGISGQGQTVVVLERTDVYSLGDWYAFRRIFGLSKPFPNATYTQIHPTSTLYPCSAPGVNGDDDEAILDAEWASAAAPNANIVAAACRDTFDFGAFIAMRNLLMAQTFRPL